MKITKKDIPDSWKLVKFEDIIESSRYGYTSKSTRKKNGERYLRITDINEDGTISDKSPKYVEIDEKDLKKYLLKEGDVVIARSGSVGLSYTHKAENERMVYASYLIRFRPDQNKVLPEFISYFLHSNYFWNWIERTKRTAAQSNINATEIKNINFPLPSLKVQKKIVEKLDSIFKKINSIKETNSKGKECQEMIEKSIISDIFCDAKASKKSIDKILTLRNGKYLPKKKHKKKGKYDVYGANGIIGKYSDFYINKETLAIGRVGSCGEVHKVNNKSWITDNAMYVKEFDDNFVILCYLYYFLKSINFDKLISTTGQPSINQGNIESLSIPLPSLNEQKKIVKKIERIEEKIKNVKEKTEDREEKIDKLSKSILNKAFTGELI